jgi:hypothetical protein
MKTLMKVALPCLALLVLISAKPAENDPPVLNGKTYAIEKVRSLPTNYTVTNSDGGNCINQGNKTITVQWSGGTLAGIRIDPVVGFTVTSTNPQSTTCCSASWSINVTSTHNPVSFYIYGKETAGGSYTYLFTSCFKICSAMEECQ